MAEKYDYDFLIIGGGSAGTTAAMAAAGFGKKVLLVEKGLLGGTCTNVGCVPSKTFLRAAELIREVNAANERGLISGRPTVNFSPVKSRREKIIKLMRDSGEKTLKNAGVRILRGRAVLNGPESVAVDGSSYGARNILVAAGAKPFIPPIDGLNDIPYLTSTNALEIEELPKSIIIIGGSYIGLEFATFFNSFGVKTTIVEALDRLAPTEDRQVSDYIAQSLDRQNIEIALNARINKVGGDERLVRLEAQRGNERLSFEGEKVLVATGRVAELTGLGLENAGVDYSRKGIKINDYLQSTAQSIYAAGDILPPPPLQLEHVAVFEGWTAANNMFTSAKQAIDYRVVPRVIFCHPEIASVGETEEQAEEHTSIATILFPYAGIPRSQIDDETEGFIKLIADADSNRLLGAHIVGANAGNLIHLAALAIRFDTPIDRLAESISAYPTHAQGFYYACERLDNKLKSA